MSHVWFKIVFDDERSIGPGKVRLLELIAETGSISAAGRAMHMSYRRAWLLVEELNAAFASPLVRSQTGGKGGGGARLTERGTNTVARYRDLETEIARATCARLTAFERSLGEAVGASRAGG